MPGLLNCVALAVSIPYYSSMDKRSRDLQNKIDAKRRRGGRGGRRRSLDAAQRLVVKEEYASDPDASCRSLGLKYGVSPATIWRIIKAAVVVLLLSSNVACGPLREPAEDPAWESFEALDAEGETIVSDLLIPAVSDWAVATGRDIRVEAGGGVPVLFVEQSRDDKGNPTCGVTHITYYSDDGSFRSVTKILVSYPIPPFCGALEYTIRHELGHAIRHADRDREGEHTPRGLMSATARSKHADYGIDADALDYVCEIHPCD